MEFSLPTGTFESTLDEKGRVVIPASLRDCYMGNLVITQGLEACVWIMTDSVYQSFLKNINNLADTLSYEEIEALRYHHEAPARPVEIDPKTGRVPIPAALRSYAKLSKDCLVLSIDGHLEVWNEEKYSVFSGETQLVAKEAKKKLAGKVSLFPKGDKP
ncbi:MAG: division/cell wall cluster transcriptional repressor MraZ [Treponema sp.]|nr:division/cell wall cluster transcriptional repressor MraZ [Treponema sp.]